MTYQPKPNEVCCKCAECGRVRVYLKSTYEKQGGGTGKVYLCDSCSKTPYKSVREPADPPLCVLCGIGTKKGQKCSLCGHTMTQQRVNAVRAGLEEIRWT